MRLRLTSLIAALLLAPALLAAQSKLPAPKKYAYLKILHLQQSPDLCLPTCVAMLLNYYGDEKTQWTIKRLSNENKDIFSATSFEEIQNGMKPLGYTWDRWQWPADSIGFLNAIDAVEQSLDAGKPVILSVNVAVPAYVHKAYAHALLVFGYDAEEREVFLMDPARPFPGKRHVSFDELREIWREGRSFYSLFTAPAGEVPVGHPK